MTSTVDLPTGDGLCKTAILRPTSGSGPWPAVIFAIDGAGPRETLNRMAQRIADQGYVVAVPDLFHRAGSVVDLLPPGSPRDPKELLPLLAQPELRATWFARFYTSATKPEHLRTDIGAVLEYFRTQKDVRPGPVGITGYCMGGNIALRVAGMFGDRVAAAASYHGGMLATDAPDSPHLGAPQMKAHLYIGAAVNDGSFPDEMKRRLEEALKTAKVDYVLETYDGARHGFAVPDHSSFNAEAAERHYQTLAALLARSLS